MSVRSLVVVLLSLMVGASIHAVPLLSESFNYPNGALVTVSGGLWTHHSGTVTGEVDVVSGRAFLTQSEGEDVNILLGANTTAVYASFLLNVTNLPSGVQYFAHLKDSGSTFRSKIFVVTNGATPGSFRVGIANAANTPSVTNTSDLVTNTDYRIVVRYLTTNATLWINPVLESDSAVSAIDPTTSISLSAFALRQNSTMGNMFVDDLVVGTSFNDVVSTNIAPFIVGQPESLTVLAGENVSFSVSANGSGLLDYHWYFNGTLLLSATNSTLSLPNVLTNQAGQYFAIVSNSGGSATSDVAVLTVVTSVVPTTVSVLHYNVKGNGATEWTTNSPQVQAIGREIVYLNPDIVAFNEIPYEFTYEMTNFVKAYLPGYNLATNSGTDNFIRSVVASRYPITRSQKWLDGADLDPFGYTSANYTRDLFEAQISIPNFETPLHLFTTHLKSSSGGYADAAAKRAAEAAAITNFFATNFFIRFPNDSYLLMGDFNEADTNTLAIQRIVNSSLGVHLTNPSNPVTGSINTYSIQASLSQRIDYICPGGALATNILSSQVFRSDKVSPLPATLLSGDSATASDHLPVMMTFSNPYNTPFSLRSISLTNQKVTLNWQSGSNRQYRVHASTDLTNWSAISPTLNGTGTNYVFTTNVSGNLKFFRVYRTP